MKSLELGLTVGNQDCVWLSDFYLSLSKKCRVQILTVLVEGLSLRSISRVCDVSINTVTKLLVDAGTVCAEFHDAKVRGVKARRV